MKRFGFKDKRESEAALLKKYGIVGGINKRLAKLTQLEDMGIVAPEERKRLG
jgi:hypothetical protein